MPLTDLTLVFLGTLALFATIGMLLPRDRTDRYVRVLMPWVAALLWGNFGLASFGSVYVGGTTLQTSMLPLAWIGVGLAMLSAFFGVYEVLVVPGKELDEAEAPMDLGGSR